MHVVCSTAASPCRELNTVVKYYSFFWVILSIFTWAVAVYSVVICWRDTDAKINAVLDSVASDDTSDLVEAAKGNGCEGRSLLQCVAPAA